MARLRKALIMERAEYWAGILGLGSWKLGVKVCKLPKGTAARVDANHEYTDALIEVDPWQTEEENLDETIVHEFVHLHLWGMGHVLTTLAKGRKRSVEWGRVEEERAVTALTRAIVRAHTTQV